MRGARRSRVLALLILTGGAVVLWWIVPGGSRLKEASFWQGLVSPGPLCAAHASLEDDCAACHTPVAGVEASSCILCHANNASLLQRQPTAFHASIGSCRVCHPEHRGRGSRATAMDHAALARIGLRMLEKDDAPDDEGNLTRDNLLHWIGMSRTTPHPGIRRLETILDCSGCHGMEDLHFGFFGKDCAECHATDRWTIPGFRHPSPRSPDCVQCHQAPPSHYMKHFEMISVRVAGKSEAKVRQCHLCHQTTSWNDILGVGWYKHH